MSDLIYEPRAYWDVTSVPVASTDTAAQTVVLDPGHFYNGERYPVTIDRVCVSMINYARKTFSDPAGVTGPTAGYNALSNILAGLKIVVSARQRQSYSRYPIDLSAFVNTPSSPLSPYFGSSDQQFSSFYGTVYRSFEPHLWMPKNGTIQFDLTPFDGYLPVSATNDHVRATIAFHERGSIFNGSMRVFSYILRDAASASAQPFGAVLSPNALVPSQGPTTDSLWPPQHTINPREWKAQSPAAQGSAEFTGISVLIDQIDYDNRNLALAPPPAISPMAMLAQRVGCRMRLSDGGTKAWFWRPGAPLALVFPDLTPALVCKLDKPITLGPGEQLEVEVTVPAVTTGTTNAGALALATTYEFGLALNGYAAIEG